MKAMVFHRYGAPDELKLEEVEKPLPKDNEVLIRIRAATVTAGDCAMRRFEIPLWLWLPIRFYMGFFSPRIKILGQELAGEIEDVGKKVTQFRKGDKIFAPTEMSFGAYAEYLCLPNTKPIATKPNNMSFEEAATICTGGLNAVHFLRKAGIQQGEKVLINGAGGSIGTYAVQIAKSLGAVVIAVDSTEKLDMLRSIGADEVIDYTQEDFTKNGETYDVIIDVISEHSFSRALNSFNQNGRYIIGNPGLSSMLLGTWNSLKNRFPVRTARTKIINAFAPYKVADLVHLKELIEAGTLKSVIDRSYPLKELAEAHRYVETGKKIGHVVITI